MAYLSVADASDASIAYATIENRAGEKVLPMVENVQQAMDEKAKDFTHR